jgi:hypothetical protein
MDSSAIPQLILADGEGESWWDKYSTYVYIGIGVFCFISAIVILVVFVYRRYQVPERDFDEVRQDQERGTAAEWTKKLQESNPADYGNEESIRYQAAQKVIQTSGEQQISAIEFLEMIDTESMKILAEKNQEPLQDILSKKSDDPELPFNIGDRQKVLENLKVLPPQLIDNRSPRVPDVLRPVYNTKRKENQQVKPLPKVEKNSEKKQTIKKWAKSLKEQSPHYQDEESIYDKAVKKLIENSSSKQVTQQEFHDLLNESEQVCINNKYQKINNKIDYSINCIKKYQESPPFYYIDKMYDPNQDSSTYNAKLRKIQEDLKLRENELIQRIKQNLTFDLFTGRETSARYISQELLLEYKQELNTKQLDQINQDLSKIFQPLITDLTRYKEHFDNIKKLTEAAKNENPNMTKEEAKEWLLLQPLVFAPQNDDYESEFLENFKSSEPSQPVKPVKFESSKMPSQLGEKTKIDSNPQAIISNNQQPKPNEQTIKKAHSNTPEIKQQDPKELKKGDEIETRKREDYK